MSRNPHSSPRRRPRRPTEPGAVYRSRETGDIVQINAAGEEEPWEPTPHDPFREPAPEPRHDLPRRADGSIAPFYSLTQDELDELGQPSARHDAKRPRHDGWTIARQQDFIETLAATASVTDACRYVGLSRQSAHKLYARSAPFRAAWDEALKAAVGVLAATAFDRAVNGTQEQVFHQGKMVGFKEKHHDRLLIYLLRVRDPLNYAPLDDLAGWQRHRALEQDRGEITPTLDRLEAAERAWLEAGNSAPRLTPPAAPVPAPSTASTLSTSPQSDAPTVADPREPPCSAAASASTGQAPAEGLTPCSIPVSATQA